MTPQPLILAERDAPFWGFGEVFLMVAVFLLALGFVIGTATHFLHKDAELGVWAVAEEFAAYLILFGALKLVFAWQKKPLLRSLGWVPQPFGVTSLLAVGFALFLISVTLQIVLRTPDTETPFQKLLEGGLVSRIAIALFGVSIGPMIEELLFRGFLQPVLMNATGVFPGILLTSILFGALHLSQNANMWQVAVLITIAGFGFGVVRHVSGSTRASTISHVAYNALPCFVTLFQGVYPNHQ